MMMKEDDTVYRKQLAKTLFTLANNSSSFYDGDIANSIIEEVNHLTRTNFIQFTIFSKFYF